MTVITSSASDSKSLPDPSSSSEGVKTKHINESSCHFNENNNNGKNEGISDTTNKYAGSETVGDHKEVRIKAYEKVYVHNNAANSGPTHKDIFEKQKQLILHDIACHSDGKSVSIDESYWRLDQEDGEWNETQKREFVSEFPAWEKTPIVQEAPFLVPDEIVVSRQAFKNFIHQLEEKFSHVEGKYYLNGEDEGRPIGIDDDDVIITLQALVRGYLVRRRLGKRRSGAEVKSGTEDRYNAVTDMQNTVVEFWLQVAMKRYIDPHRCASKKKASVLIQATYRGYLARRRDRMEAVIYEYLNRLEC